MEKTKVRKKNSIEKSVLNTKEVSEILGISQATVRNWARLDKLNPISDHPLLFDKKDIYDIHKSLDKSDLLKKRRNKSRAGGSLIPKDYISKNSPNYKIITDIIASLSEESCDIVKVISFYGKSLLKQRKIPKEIIDKLISSALEDSVKNSEAFDIFNAHALKYIPGEDTLGLLYLSIRNLREKKSTGSYYTPYYVADRLIKEISGHEDLHEKTVCDPACGTGNFLLRIDQEVPLKNIHGYDIDETAVFIARINLALKYGVSNMDELTLIFENIKVKDFLLDTDKSDKAFDVILGNPPWGYVFSAKEIQKIKKSFSSHDSKKNPESFSLFVERGLCSLKKSGTLSFLLPETILGADTHRCIRRLILSEAFVSSLIYIGDVFYKVQCPSVILTIKRGNAKALNDKDYIRVSFEEKDKESIKTINSFTASKERLSEDIFHLLCDDKEKALINKIKETPHFTLKDNAEFALGIVTGSNSSLLKSAPGKGLEPIIKGKDIEKFCLKKATNFVHFNPDAFQQCAPSALYRAKEKLFYRFIADEPIFALDTKGTLSLNSANIVLPDIPGYPAAYIMAILNSRVISFYYKKSFKNMKVLRSYLEKLPIALCDEKTAKEIAKDALKISTLDIGSHESRKLRESIEKKIYKLYDLSDDEIDIIYS